MNPEWWLKALLRLVGGVTLLAVFAIVLPTEWMAAIHAWLGLGEFPRTPITHYLTRSLSGLYAISGGALLVAASDVRRFSPLITYFGAVHIAFGIVVLAIDLFAPMPLFWTLGEGPPIVLVGTAFLLLNRRISASAGASRLVD